MADRFKALLLELETRTYSGDVCEQLPRENRQTILDALLKASKMEQDEPEIRRIEKEVLTEARIEVEREMERDRHIVSLESEVSDWRSRCTRFAERLATLETERENALLPNLRAAERLLKDKGEQWEADGKRIASLEAENAALRTERDRQQRTIHEMDAEIEEFRKLRKKVELGDRMAEAIDRCVEALRSEEGFEHDEIIRVLNVTEPAVTEWRKL